MIIDRALIVRAPYAAMIVDGLKTWEMRGRDVSPKMCGRIGIIEAGSGTIIGEVDLVGSTGPISQQIIKALVHKHQIDDFNLLDKWNVAWELEKASRYAEPVPYVHPKGAVIWVKIPHNARA